jgi:hypothetical protein
VVSHEGLGLPDGRVFGCGFFRLIWIAEHLRSQGHDIEIVRPKERKLALKTKDDRVIDVLWRGRPKPDVIVFQRITHPWLAQAVPVLRSQGIAVVVDVDDDLTSLHPRNPVYATLHPKSGVLADGGKKHSWTHLSDACRDATLVTVSTPGLLPVYAAHGRGRVLRNVLPEHYYGVPHEDSDTVGWPAALVSHPDDPSACGGAIARLVGDGADFRVLGDPSGCGAAFGLLRDPAGLGPRAIELLDWPAQVARLGIGIAPLADTKFNLSKSALKPLEMAALGVPCVMSPTDEYARLHKLGVGLLAGRARSWYSQLGLLRNDEKARRDLGEVGRAAVDGLRVVKESWRWAECWADALKIQRS